MVNVRVGENYGVNFGRREWKVAVPRFGLGAPALVLAAVQEVFAPLHFHMVHGSGYGTCRTPEC